MKKFIFLLLTGNIFIAAVHAQSWNLTGNAGINPSTNFIGTTDAKQLRFRVKNFMSGLIEYDPSIANTTFGYQAFYTNTSGKFASAFGTQALSQNTTGYANTAIGAKALLVNDIGSYNVALGARVLESNKGDNNTAAGYASLFKNTDGYNNSGYGYKSLFVNTTGYENTASGYTSMYSNTVGIANSAFGEGSLYSNTSGSRNTAIGSRSMYANTTGLSNTAVGNTALREGKTGSYNTAVGTGALYFTNASANTATGSLALYSNTTGAYNSAYGTNSLYRIVGTGNSAFGYNSGINSISGNYNSIFGYNAMATYSGSNNTAIGTNTVVTADGITNSTMLGNEAVATASDQVRIGNSLVTSIGGQVDWTTLSDGRFKKDIQDNVPGLSFIKKLKPVTYHKDVQGIQKYLKQPNTEQATGAAKEDHAKILYTGFVAQEVEKAAKDINFDFSGVDVPKNKEDYYGLRYAEFVVPLVKAVQELSNENDDLKKQNNNQQKINTSLQQQIDDLKASLAGTTSSALTSNTKRTGIETEAGIEQNIPNPARNITTIKYKFPTDAKTAYIIFTSAEGVQKKVITLTQKGGSQISVNTNEFAPGTYFYSLWADGKMAGSKKMIVIR